MSLKSFSSDFYRLVDQYKGVQDPQLQRSIEKSKKLLESRSYMYGSEDPCFVDTLSGTFRKIRDYFSGPGSPDFLRLKHDIRELAVREKKKLGKVCVVYTAQIPSTTAVPSLLPGRSQGTAISPAPQELDSSGELAVEPVSERFPKGAPSTQLPLLEGTTEIADIEKKDILTVLQPLNSFEERLAEEVFTRLLEIGIPPTIDGDIDQGNRMKKFLYAHH